MTPREYAGRPTGPARPEPARPTRCRTRPAETHWQRLDPRMLLVHPIREVMRFLPALIGLFVAGAATDRGRLVPAWSRS